MKSNTFDFYSSNPRNNSFYSQNEENNRFQKKLFNMTRTLASEPTSDKQYTLYLSDFNNFIS